MAADWRSPVRSGHAQLTLASHRELQAVKTLALVLLMFLPSMVALAAGDEGSNWGRMTEVYLSGDGHVLRVRFSRPIVNPARCEGGDFYVRELDDSAASDRFLKTVLAAHLADRKVEFWIVGCTKSRWWGKTRPQIYDIYIGD